MDAYKWKQLHIVYKIQTHKRLKKNQQQNTRNFNDTKQNVCVSLFFFFFLLLLFSNDSYTMINENIIILIQLRFVSRKPGVSGMEDC